MNKELKKAINFILNKDKNRNMISRLWRLSYKR
jgi:hypothetical protein